MSRLATAFVLVLAATAADAPDTKSEQSQTPTVASANGTRPFLFDGRMPGDGALANDHHPNAGAIVVPPKASQPPPLNGLSASSTTAALPRLLGLGDRQRDAIASPRSRVDF